MKIFELTATSDLASVTSQNQLKPELQLPAWQENSMANIQIFNKIYIPKENSMGTHYKFDKKKM